MKVGLNVALSPDSTDRGLLDALGALGWQVIRTDVEPWWTDAQVRNVLGLFVGALVEPLVLLSGGHMTWTDGRRVEPHELAGHARRVVQIGAEIGLPSLMMEIGNEPDLAAAKNNAGYNRHPEDCALAVSVVRDALRALDPQAVLITPGIANLCDRGRSYLGAMRGAGLPSDVWIGYHRYGEGLSPSTPHQHFLSREDEWAQVIGTETRPTACTEFGWHTATEHGQRLTDEQATANLLSDLRFFSAHGSMLAIVYQINSGPQDISDHQYGIRRLDGTWKPSANVARRFRDEQEVHA